MTDQVDLDPPGEDTIRGAFAKYNSHEARKDNPHGTTAAQVGAPTSAAFNAHLADTGNPHAVTKAQLGLANVTNDAQLKAASNLSDLPDAQLARINLGVGIPAIFSEKSSDYTVTTADLSGVSELTVPFSISAASRTCTLTSVASLNGKIVRAMISTGPASDTSSNKLTVYQSDGITEIYTGYAKGDFILVTSDGSNYRVLDERVTVVGRLALTADENFSTGTTTKIFDASYSEVRDIGNWWSSINHRLEAAFACDIEVSLALLESTSGYLKPIVSVNGSAIHNGYSGNGYGVGRGLPLLVKMASGDYLDIKLRNDSGVNATVMGDAALNESQLFWRVARRIR